MVGSYALWLTNSQVALSVSLSGTVVGVVGATTNTDGSWHLIAGVYDSTQLAVYLDGFVDGAATAASGKVDVVSAPFVFGQVQTTMNDVHLYSRALSPDELASYSSLNDGIPDFWKVAYGFSITDPSVADADPLGQGISNLEAYFYGLNPWQPDSSYPVVDPAQSTPSNSVIAVDATLSSLPLLEVSLSSNMASPLILSNDMGNLTLTPPGNTVSNYTLYFQYETAQTNALGNQFTKTALVDTEPPTLTLDPGTGQTLDRSYPLMIAQYADVGSGVDISTVSIHIDGTDVTTNFYVLPSAAIGSGGRSDRRQSPAWSASLARACPATRLRPA